jgi:hypothetical protein
MGRKEGKWKGIKKIDIQKETMKGRSGKLRKTKKEVKKKGK